MSRYAPRLAVKMMLLMLVLVSMLVLVLRWQLLVLLWVRVVLILMRRSSSWRADQNVSRVHILRSRRQVPEVGH